jgi:light-regulated signal transduction histidine kinase (bacteriophytochrome)
MDAYLLAGTPCEQVCDRNALCTFAPGVAQRFPEDEMLALMGVEWYTGVPLHDGAGQVVGVLCALHDTPVEVPTAMEEVFSIFSQRAGVEIVRKRAAELLAQKAQALARSNAELQHFAYIASHDLQEPLRMVTSFLELLKRHCEGQFDAQAEEFWAFAFDGAKRMQHMINDLLTYSRVGTHGQDFAPVDCEDVLERTLTNLRMMIDEQGAQVTGDPLPVVMGDETQLGQLFQNLISNAVKFRGAHPPEVHVGARRMGRTWRFSVRDNGIGIPAKHRERIFLMFQRLHTQEEYPGSGIGLAICQKIVERHGGRIWVESQPGEGSTFYFTLPVSVSSTDR